MMATTATQEYKACMIVLTDVGVELGYEQWKFHRPVIETPHRRNAFENGADVRFGQNTNLIPTQISPSCHNHYRLLWVVMPTNMRSVN